MANSDPIIGTIQEEISQSPRTRKPLYVSIQKELDRPVLCFFTSFVFTPSISHQDVDVLEDVLQAMDLTKSLAVMVSSPGGDGLAAERIVNLCRQYSGTKEYWAIVPSRAKSAATMLCLGASKIMMGPSSELGPIDPQLHLRENGVERYFSAWTVVQSYKKLFKGALRTKGNLEPYIQQLEHYDCRDIQKYEQIIDLTDDIAVKALSTGMMAGTPDDQIRQKMALFLNPDSTKSHARPIYADDASQCGLKIEKFGARTQKWKDVYELYLRLHNVTQTRSSKVIETAEGAFHAPTRNREDD